MAETTVVPFSALPSCAVSCYHLYDANGACVPPAVATASSSVYASCFCSNSYLTPFSTGTAGVCDDACTLATETDGLASIRNWYTSYCAANENAVASTTSTSTSSSSTSKSTSGSSSGGSNTWLSSHWQWVVFIVVVVVGIAGIWTGACLWHRRYLRRKDRQYALGNIRASAASGTTGLNNNASQYDLGGRNSVHGVGSFGTGGAEAAAAASTGTKDAGVYAPGAAGGTYDTEKRRSVLGRRRN